MNEWIKIAENLAHKRAGVILAAIAAITLGDVSIEGCGVIMAGAVIYTVCQTISDRGNNGTNR